MGEVLNNGVYLPDRGERNAYDGLKGNWNTLDSIAGKVPGYDVHISDTDIHVTAADKQIWNGKADASHVHNANDVTTGVFDAARIPNLDASKITTGTIDIDRLPQGALERLVKVADQAARYALTASDVQLGDTVQQLDTGVMYVVTDETKLDSAEGYTEYTAGSATSVPWSGVTGKPADYTPASHSHGNITNDGKVGTNANVPLITGTGGVVQAGSFGTSANTFCEGNDSRLSDARTPVAHTHTKSDVTDLLNSNFIPSANNSYDLGSSSYQWNNVYAKQYYLNSVAFGDIATHNNSEFVHNTGTETIAGTKTFSDNLVVKRNDAAKLYLIDTRADRTYDASQTVDSASRIEITDKDNVLLNRISAHFTVNKQNIMVFTDYTEDSSGNQISRDLSFSLNQDGTCVFYPSQNNAINLGTSTNKWKTLNGVNPGALGMPTVATTFEDLTGYVLDGVTENTFPISGLTAYDGWLQCRVIHTLGVASFLRMEMSYRVWTAQDKDCAEEYVLWVPVRAGMSFNKVVCKADDLKIRFHPCVGNV